MSSDRRPQAERGVPHQRFAHRPRRTRSACLGLRCARRARLALRRSRESSADCAPIDSGKRKLARVRLCDGETNRSGFSARSASRKSNRSWRASVRPALLPAPATTSARPPRPRCAAALAASYRPRAFLPPAAATCSTGRRRARQQERERRSQQQRGKHGQRVAHVEEQCDIVRTARTRSPARSAPMRPFRRTRFSPSLNCWYLPFCNACTGSTRAALRAGMNRRHHARDHAQHHRKRHQRRIGRDLVGPLRDAVNFAQQRSDVAGHHARDRDSEPAARDADPNNPATTLSPRNRCSNLPPRGTQRAQNPDLRSAAASPQSGMCCR